MSSAIFWKSRPYTSLNFFDSIIFSEGYRRYLALWLILFVCTLVHFCFCLNDQAYNCLIHFYKRGISMNHHAHHTSCIMHHALCIIHHASYIMHHASYIIHHTSCIMHHASCIKHHASCITQRIQP